VHNDRKREIITSRLTCISLRNHAVTGKSEAEASKDDNLYGRSSLTLWINAIVWPCYPTQNARTPTLTTLDWRKGSTLVSKSSISSVKSLACCWKIVPHRVASRVPQKGFQQPTKMNKRSQRSARGDIPIAGSGLQFLADTTCSLPVPSAISTRESF
jgi:hypothetical protein